MHCEKSHTGSVRFLTVQVYLTSLQCFMPPLHAASAGPTASTFRKRPSGRSARMEGIAAVEPNDSSTPTVQTDGASHSRRSQGGGRDNRRGTVPRRMVTLQLSLPFEPS